MASERRLPGVLERRCPSRKGWWQRCRLVEKHDPPHEVVIGHKYEGGGLFYGGWEPPIESLILEKWGQEVPDGEAQ